MIKKTYLLIIVLCSSLYAAEIPDRPEKLDFPPLDFEVPDAAEMRAELDNGIPVYLAEDRQLPLINLSVRFRGGGYLDPAGKEGLADLTGDVWRRGGAGAMTAEELDEELDFLAANVSTGIGSTTGSVNLNILSKDLERGMEIFMDVLLRPAFQQDRLEKARTDAFSAMQRRNDDTSSIERREWNRLIYGEDFWINRLATKASLESISRDELVAFQGRLINPNSMVVAVSGDFERAAMLDLLNRTIGQIATSDEELPPIPQPEHTPKAGLYVVDKPDVNQGRTSIGHIGLKYPVEDEFALRLADDVLGGGGFTSWILSRVRSDEGLAYSAGSNYSIGTEIPGTFRTGFQSKSSTVARAAQLVLELIDRMRTEGPSEEELKTAKNSLILAFPNNFSSPGQTASLFAGDELLGRPHDYWTTYRDKARAVTTADALAAAGRHIHPDQFVILIVGNIEEILQGSPDYPAASIEALGEITRLPLRDPMTLEPIQE